MLGIYTFSRSNVYPDGLQNKPTELSESPAKSEYWPGTIGAGARAIPPVRRDCDLSQNGYLPPIMFYIIGLGLSDEKDITVRGLEVIDTTDGHYRHLTDF